MAPRPTYQKVIPTAKLNDIAEDAKPVTREQLAAGRDTRPNGAIKTRT